MEQFQVTKRDTNPEKRMPYWDHLEELRQRLLKAFVAIFVFAVVAFLFKSFIFNQIIFAPLSENFLTYKALCKLGQLINSNGVCLKPTEINLINIDIAGQFKAHLLVSLIIGLALAFPYLIYQLWLFIKPALRYSEKISFRAILWSASLLFSVGLLFGYYVILPLALNFLANYEVSEQLKNQINFQSYLSLLLTLTAGSALVFELPVLVYFLTKAELITSQFLKEQRKLAIVAIFLLAAILTPPDVFSQILLAIPLILLYEISISIAVKVEKSRIHNFE